MAFVRLLKDLMRDKEFGQRIVPIIPDEARTFGMDAFFPTIKIYNPHGQNYTPVDAELHARLPRGRRTGRSSTSASTRPARSRRSPRSAVELRDARQPMIPIYVFYSMFGFQRTGDSIWAAADQMTRGFLIGATAGRTTLTGEGLQHADGHSPLLASTNPAVVHYDPAYAYEIAHIMQDGLHRMYGEGTTPARSQRHLLPHRLQRADRSSRPSPTTSTSRASCAACTAISGADRRAGRRTRRARRSSAPASACRGRSRPSSCSPTTGASPPTCGR